MPRGLGLATATTSAAFFPHCDLGSGAIASSVSRPCDGRGEFTCHSALTLYLVTWATVGCALERLRCCFGP